MQPLSGSVIGNTTDPKAATTEQFKVFWKELAWRFVNNTNVMCVRPNSSRRISDAPGNRRIALESTTNLTSKSSS